MALQCKLVGLKKGDQCHPTVLTALEGLHVMYDWN